MPVLAAVERRSSMVAGHRDDTLLVENDAERLEKGEEADAIDEYEPARAGRRGREERRASAPVRGGGGAARGGGAGGAGARQAREGGAAARGLDAAPNPRWSPDTITTARLKPYYYHNAEWAEQARRPGPGHTIWAHPGLTRRAWPGRPPPPPTPWHPGPRSTRPRPWRRRWRRCLRPRPRRRGGADGADLAGARARAVRDADGVERGPFAAPAAAAGGPRRLDRDAGAARRDARRAEPPSTSRRRSRRPWSACREKSRARRPAAGSRTGRRWRSAAADGWTKEEKQREGSATSTSTGSIQGGKKAGASWKSLGRAYPLSLGGGRRAKADGKEVAGGPHRRAAHRAGPHRLLLADDRGGPRPRRGELNASGKIRYEGNEYVPTGFARRPSGATWTSATGTTFINGYTTSP